MDGLGHFIAAHRTARKISMRKLAELAQLSHTEIYRLENGERKHPSPSVLKSIALALNLNYNELMRVAGYLEENSSPEGYSRSPIDINDLTENEIQEVQRFIDYLRYKRSRTQ